MTITAHIFRFALGFTCALALCVEVAAATTLDHLVRDVVLKPFSLADIRRAVGAALAPPDATVAVA